MKQTDDREMQRIIRAAQKGDERAFEHLLEHVEAPVYRLALSMTRSREDAEDAAQEALVKLWRSLPSYRFECSILSYALQIARNATLDLLRRERAHRENTMSMTRTDEEGEAAELDVADTDVSADPVRSYERQERARLVREAISLLPDEQRQILVLRDMNGCSYEQIGQTLGLEMGTVKSRLARARKNLAELLKTRNIF